MSDTDKCEHKWHSFGRWDAPPSFTLNRHMGNEPTAHFTCDRCGARTWFTETQWEAMPRKRKAP